MRGLFLSFDLLFHKDMTNDWTRPEFLTYLFLYALKAEPGVKPEEFEYVKNHVGLDNFQTVRKSFDAHSDYENAQTIGSLARQYCPDEASREAVLSELEGLLNADGHVSASEMTYFVGLRKLLA
jgi:hypothetical protein